MTYKPKEKILTAGELCQWWGITKDQLDKLRLKKALPYVELAKSVYIFREADLAAWAERNRRVVSKN